MPLPTEIVSRESLGIYLKDPVVPGSYQDDIRLSINSAVTKYCGRPIVPRDDYVEKVSIREDFRTKFYVKNPPIRELISLSSGRTSPSLVSADSYVVSNDKTGEVEMVDTFLIKGIHQYTVAYKGGFNPIPPELQLFAKSIMAREIAKVALGRHGMRGRAFAQGSAEFLQLDLEPQEKAFLDRYQLKIFV
jgi:hypothetical protein